MDHNEEMTRSEAQVLSIGTLPPLWHSTADDWIEIFHSMPSLEQVYIIYSQDGGKWTPRRAHALEDASHVRDEFRVFRIHGCRQLEFVLTDGQRYWDNNYGANYRITQPGRYVVGVSGLQRKGDVDMDEVRRMLLRGVDEFIELLWEAPAEWTQAYVLYATAFDTDNAWIAPPGDPMSQPVHAGGRWFCRIRAQQLEFVLHNGRGVYHKFHGKNFRCHSPGRYVVRGMSCEYVGRSERDKAKHAAVNQVDDTASRRPTP
ncbi:hypothetical protein CDCA_CDCA13G3568 [Cyanidium caldarium]|uniref:Carbohydrate binding module family 25 domain-containing protein n=1 Tax=Cyanidium caldarium TaxID=2771 RepID=A0AAV9J0J5_CYACA|nr:hypothetical protein CDCA_CDCA13G3568 [Cyanidium caldarium]